MYKFDITLLGLTVITSYKNKYQENPDRLILDRDQKRKLLFYFTIIYCFFNFCWEILIEHTPRLSDHILSEINLEQ